MNIYVKNVECCESNLDMGLKEPDESAALKQKRTGRSSKFNPMFKKSDRNVTRSTNMFNYLSKK